MATRLLLALFSGKVGASITSAWESVTSPKPNGSPSIKQGMASMFADFLKKHEARGHQWEAS
jgi:hypothetical protein